MERRIIKVDGNLRELSEHGTAAFPMTVSYDDLYLFENRCVRCHWHDDLEIVVIRQGTVEYQIGSRQFLLSPGHGLVINSGVPHSTLPCKESHVTMIAIIIRPEFFGTAGSDIEQNCLRPFLRNKNLPAVHLSPANEWANALLHRLNQVEQYYTSRPFAFELKIKSLLCDCLFELLAGNQEKIASYQPFSQEHLRTLKLLLDYIHEHYPENIQLQTLADLVPLSRESCCRFFKQMTGKTITQYVTDYRISQSLRLLSEGQYSVTQAAELTGFSSASRFAQAFRLRMGTNPKEYLQQGKRPH